MYDVVAEFTDANFEGEVLQSHEPVLVDFWAPWCPPCRQIMPIIEQLADENAGHVKIGKLNIDAAPGIAKSFRVEAIPTVLLFHQGEVVDTFLGVQSKSRLQTAIDAIKS